MLTINSNIQYYAAEQNNTDETNDDTQQTTYWKTSLYSRYGIVCKRAIGRSNEDWRPFIDSFPLICYLNFFPRAAI